MDAKLHNNRQNEGNNHAQGQQRPSFTYIQKRQFPYKVLIVAARAAISLSRGHTLIDKRASCDMFSNAPFQLEFRLPPVVAFRWRQQQTWREEKQRIYSKCHKWRSETISPLGGTPWNSCENSEAASGISYWWNEKWNIWDLAERQYCILDLRYYSDNISDILTV